MSTVSGSWRACLLGLALRTMGMALGLLFIGLLTAAAASAQSADLSINTLVDSPDPIAGGGSLTYTITVINNGPNPASNVVVSDAPPSNVRVNEVSCQPGWVAQAVGADPFRAVATCSIASLAPGATGTMQLGVVPNLFVPTGTVITDTATITSTTVDPFLANNSATTTTTINPGASPPAVADVAVTKTGPAGGILAGQSLAYTITVTNNGPSAATTAALSESTPPNTTFVSLVQNTGPVFTCKAPAAGAVGAINCQIASLAAGFVATFTMTVQIDAGTANGTVITNLAEGGSNTTDTTPANNRATVTTLVGPLPTNTPTPTPSPTVTPTATPTCILGDINCDGIVDIRDYGIWRANFGQQGAGNPADLDQNGIVDIRDYGVWRQNFGHTAGAPPRAASSGPSPTSTATPTPRSGRPPASHESGSPWGVLLKAVQALGITFPNEIMLQVTEILQ